MYFVKRKTTFNYFKSISTLIRCYRITRKDHYEVLNLRRNCSDKEIKDAFIQLSKEFHPDKNKDVQANDKFVRIVEAYNVLSKPSSRARYDSVSEYETYSTPSPYVYKPHVPYNLRKNPQYSYYYDNDRPKSKTSQQSTNTYYGMAGVKKLPNFVIIFICFGVALVGVIVQVFVIRNLYVAQTSQAMEKTKRLAEDLEKVRTAATEHGNEMQTRILLDKIVTAANPTVATASLGQALASEKKK